MSFVPPDRAKFAAQLSAGRGLYVIVDADACTSRGLELLDVARAVLDAAPPLVQLRAKHRTDEQIQDWLRQIKAMAHGTNSLVFANDRPELAEACGCHGVHLGQSDAPVSEVRERYPRLLVGLSTHDEAQLERGLAERPDYLALGPVYGTQSKMNPEPSVGARRFIELAPRAHRAGVPLVAIGGLSSERAVEVAANCPYVAVISAVLPAPSGRAVACEPRAALEVVRDATAHLDRMLQA